MIQRTHWLPAVLATALAVSLSACTDAVDALTSHARPVAAVGGESLGTAELATMMAESTLPDSALSAHWAAQIGRLWADYISLVLLYQTPDTTAALDFDPLLRDARYYPALAVQRFRDSVVLADLDPTPEEVRQWFERTQPLTRLDVRRIRLGVPPGASESVRDSLFAEARRLRERVAGGADFVELARAASDEPAASRGQALAYQGHMDFHPAADSVVFDLRPGEISPVIVTDDEIVFYLIERRRTPKFETAEDMVRSMLVTQRRERRLAQAADSLLGNSRRTVADGAERVARLIATSPDMAADRVAGSLRLVRYEGGEFTVSELRLLFQVRHDIRNMFSEADDDDIGLYLYQLAGDEILTRAAFESGVGVTQEMRDDLRRGIASQLAGIAERMKITHALVTNPAFDLERESRRFIATVLDRSVPVPLATEFRPVLDQRYASRVDERSAEAAARLARKQRGLDREDTAPSLTDTDTLPSHADEKTPTTGDTEDESTTSEGEST